MANRRPKIFFAAINPAELASGVSALLRACGQVLRVYVGWVLWRPPLEHRPPWQSSVAVVSLIAVLCVPASVWLGWPALHSDFWRQPGSPWSPALILGVVACISLLYVLLLRCYWLWANRRWGAARCQCGTLHAWA